MKTVILLCASLLATSSGEAWGEAPSASESVSYADLNISSAAGQQRLKNRISFAAYRLCLVDGPASPSPATADPQCYRSAITDAIAQMNKMVPRAKGAPELAAAAGVPRR
jgi:UrcA family protein